jgi:hypothetical protein
MADDPRDDDETTITEIGRHFMAALDRCLKKRPDMTREAELAKVNLEQAVMWAVRGVWK